MPETDQRQLKTARYYGFSVINFSLLGATVRFVLVAVLFVTRMDLLMLIWTKLTYGAYYIS